MKREAFAQRRGVFLVIAWLAAFVALGCGKGGEGGGGASGEPRRERAAIRIAVVTHGQASDTFWSVVKNGVDRAAKDMGVTVTYNAPQTFDMVAMSRLIDAEVAKKPDGLVVSVPDPRALAKSLEAARSAGIPIVTINSGGDAGKEMGALIHVGQAEYDAGKGGGERMAKAGAKSAICVNHEVGNASQDERCRGFGDAMEKAGGKSRVLAVNAADLTDAQGKIGAALTEDVDAVFTLGPLGSRAALGALKAAGKLGKVQLGTFDLSPDVLAAVRDGQMAFAIDQQQYLQGYLPVVMLTQYKLYGVMPAGGALPTGPAFVTKDNAAAVINWTKEGLR
ncbi:sugar ABC transporter substrate-binding protein [Polyangium aurulentum]|uniref:sugar ABC transporter substrate-binding protein n=1 Tax=Polyangium aurulentum TaxID=2567896 RepID=UPI00197EC199|nr:sugar ABC transporter substrate-binding protein [Polyangium aurulentum]UQA57575.1 sugar ABC transporter substrate-binding protein [Polyangium aurulentum]